MVCSEINDVYTVGSFHINSRILKMKACLHRIFLYSFFSFNQQIFINIHRMLGTVLELDLMGMNRLMKILPSEMTLW